MNRVIVVGSPRVDGRSASLADELLYACIDEFPDDVVSIVSVASTQVGPCRGCDGCRQAQQAAPEGPEEGDPLSPHPLVVGSDAALHACVIDDDMPEVRKHLDAADELIVVSPVYFAGAPAQFKALLDRLQPYYYSNVRTRGKRPLVLHVVGEGGDPHGFDPLVGTVQSAFSVAGFHLESIFDWVGAIDAEGNLVGEPQEYLLDDEEGGCEGSSAASASGRGTQMVDSPDRQAPRTAHDGKPRLSLSQPTKGSKRAAGAQQGAARKHGGRVSGKGGTRKGGKGSAAKSSSGKGGSSKGSPRRGGRRG